MKPLSKPTLLIVRHGDTSMNDANELRGWDDPPLNEEGHAQAHLAAEKIRKMDVPLHHIYSGTLDRTKKTAAHIRAATGVDTTETPALNPWDYGDLTGQPENHANQKKLKFFQNRPNIPTSNGESYGNFVGRYGKVLTSAKDYVHKFPEKALVLVTHSRNLYPTKHILDGHSQIPTKDPQYGPGTVHKVEFDPGGSGDFKMRKV
jgi:broad specificity phosphatase PhoE